MTMRIPTPLFLTLLLAGCGPRPAETPAPAPLGVEVPNTGPDPVLPEPDTMQSVTRLAVLRPWPRERTPVAPPGFEVSLFADGFQRPRWLHVLPNGDLLVAESANPGRRDTLMPPEQGRRPGPRQRGTRQPDHPAVRRRRRWPGLTAPLPGPQLADGDVVPRRLALRGHTGALVRYPFARATLRSRTAPPALERRAAATIITGPERRSTPTALAHSRSVS
jgi:hypothetical protein